MHSTTTHTQRKKPSSPFHFISIELAKMPLPYLPEERVTATAEARGPPLRSSSSSSFKESLHRNPNHLSRKQTLVTDTTTDLCLILSQFSLISASIVAFWSIQDSQSVLSSSSTAKNPIEMSHLETVAEDCVAILVSALLLPINGWLQWKGPLSGWSIWLGCMGYFLQKFHDTTMIRTPNAASNLPMFWIHVIALFSSFWGILICGANLNASYLRSKTRYFLSMDFHMSKIFSIVVLACLGISIPVTNLYSLVMAQQKKALNDGDSNCIAIHQMNATANQALINTILVSPTLWVCVWLTWKRVPLGTILVPAVMMSLGLFEVKTFFQVGFYIFYPKVWNENAILNILPSVFKAVALLLGGLFTAFSLP